MCLEYCSLILLKFYISVYFICILKRKIHMRYVISSNLNYVSLELLFCFRQIFLCFSGLPNISVCVYARAFAHAHTHARILYTHATATFESCPGGIKLLETYVQPRVHPKIQF